MYGTTTVDVLLYMDMLTYTGTVTMYGNATVDVLPYMDAHVHSSVPNCNSICFVLGYPLLLTTLIQKTDSPLEIRVAAAITFKNFVKRNWRVNWFYLPFYVIICHFTGHSRSTK